MDTLEVTSIKKSESLEALNRSEIDVQIATAKQYPRDVVTAKNTIAALATIDAETADECFYSLTRKGRDGKESAIEGPSVRLAEIAATCWGNLRVASRIIGNDGKTLTAQGICHDLETNVAVSSEVQRRICTKDGKTFSDDMQVVTGNAAAAIAFRNAVFKIIPKAVINSALKEIRQFQKNSITDLASTIQKIVAVFAKKGVTEEMLTKYLRIESINDITADMVIQLRGVNTAINEGTTTVKETFIQPFEDKKKAAEMAGSVNTAKGKISAALKKQQEEEAPAIDADMPIFEA